MLGSISMIVDLKKSFVKGLTLLLKDQNNGLALIQVGYFTVIFLGINMFANNSKELDGAITALEHNPIHINVVFDTEFDLILKFNDISSPGVSEVSTVH